MRRLCRFWVPDPEFHFSLIHRENKMFLLYSFIILTGILLSEAQTRDTKVCTIKEMMELCVQREVIGVQGEDAILPCLFRHNEGNNTSELVFILYKDNDFIYDSMSSSKGRIQIVGNPSEGDGTVRIRDLKMEDEGMYGCGFRFKKLGDQQFTTIFTNKERRSELRVHVRPKILRIWREFMKSSNNTRLFCEAEAKPRPNMTWWSPNGHPVNGSYSMDIPNNQRYSQKIISSYNITRENPEGNYSCLVQNQYGAVNGFVLYKEGEETSEERGITKIVIGCSLSLILILLLFLFGFLIYKKQWNPTEGNPNHLEDIPEMGLKDEPSYMTLRKKHCDVNESHLYDMLSS